MLSRVVFSGIGVYQKLDGANAESVNTSAVVGLVLGVADATGVLGVAGAAGVGVFLNIELLPRHRLGLSVKMDLPL